MSKTRVLLVDDNGTMRYAVRRLFNSHPKFEVCGEAEHGREAVEKAPNLLPDLIMLDHSMPVMNGLEAAPLLLKLLPEVWLILFSPRRARTATSGSHSRNTRGRVEARCLDAPDCAG
jgi:chemotaxis response regulator CheB